MNYIKDVALYNNDGTVNGVIEICPNTKDKNELVEPGFNRLQCVRKITIDYPFYYGSFPQTYAGDKDPLDMILFTNKDHKVLDLVKVDVIGAVKTVDCGEQDDKIICVESDCSLIKVKKHLKKAIKFLHEYKGKDADMQIDKKLASRLEADELVSKSNEEYINMNKKGVKVTAQKSSNTDKKDTSSTAKSSNNRVRVVTRG